MILFTHSSGSLCVFLHPILFSYLQTNLWRIRQMRLTDFCFVKIHHLTLYPSFARLFFVIIICRLTHYSSLFAIHGDDNPTLSRMNQTYAALLDV